MKSMHSRNGARALPRPCADPFSSSLFRGDTAVTSTPNLLRTPGPALVFSSGGAVLGREAPASALSERTECGVGPEVERPPRSRCVEFTDKSEVSTLLVRLPAPPPSLRT